MNPYSQVLIIDELSISYEDIRKMEDGKTTETEETLAWLADNTAMTLAALSSSSLLDRVTYDAVYKKVLDEMIARTGFKAVSLKHMMVQPEHCISHLPGRHY